MTADETPAGGGNNADNPPPAGYHGDDIGRARWKAEAAQWRAAKRRRGRRLAQYRPGMSRKPPPQAPEPDDAA